MYAIAMADHDQENMEISKDILRTKDGIDRLSLFLSSMGRLIPLSFLCSTSYSTFLSRFTNSSYHIFLISLCLYVLNMG